MSFKFSDMYKPLKKDASHEAINAQKRSEEERRKLRDIGQACLSDPKFQKYLEAFKSLEKTVMNDIRAYKNPDPVQYAMAISNMISELNTLEALIEDVKADSNKKVQCESKSVV